MKRPALLTSRVIRAYVKEKLRGYAERQAERERVRREGRQQQIEQQRLFE